MSKRLSFSGFSWDVYQRRATNPEGVVVVLEGFDKTVFLFFEDEEQRIGFDPAEISVSLRDEKGSELFFGSYAGGEIVRRGLGEYFVVLPFSRLGRGVYRLLWRWKEKVDDVYYEDFVSVAYVVGVKVWEWMVRLKNQIDKAKKRIGSEMIGYTDANLYLYLKGGLDEINSVPPVTSFTLENFPENYGQLLINSATIVALYSQILFAIDTDVPTYSDQGQSFPVEHASKLQSYLSSLISKVGTDLRNLKLEFSEIGAVLITLPTGYVFWQVIKSAPTGSIFKNLFVSGG